MSQFVGCSLNNPQKETCIRKEKKFKISNLSPHLNKMKSGKQLNSKQKKENNIGKNRNQRNSKQTIRKNQQSQMLVLRKPYIK